MKNSNNNGIIPVLTDLYPKDVYNTCLLGIKHYQELMFDLVIDLYAQGEDAVLN